MTNIILHGGYGGYWDNAGQDTALYGRLLEAAKQADNKLLISFLSKPDLSGFPFIDELYATLEKMRGDVEVTLADRSNFHELLPQHQVLFLQGGDSNGHEAFLADTTAEQLSAGKTTLGGSSSGAMMLCQHGFSNSGKAIITGKGILDFSVVPHANSWPMEEYVPKLRAATQSPIMLVNEDQMIELDIA